MNYWRGFMDWPLNEEWKCGICGNRILIWGLPHALCRCAVCHAQYRMRDEKQEITDTPICQIKTEYYQAFKKIWNETKAPIDEVEDSQWDEKIPKLKEAQ